LLGGGLGPVVEFGGLGGKGQGAEHKAGKQTTGK